VKRNGSAAFRGRDGFHGEIAIGAGFPANAGFGGGAGAARNNFDSIGDDEGGVEADTELPDEGRVFLLVAGQGFEELGGAGAGDGAEVGNRILAGHANAVVTDGDGASLGIRVDFDFQVGAVFQEFGVCNCRETQAIVRV